MNWVEITIAILAVLIAVTAGIKIRLRNKLHDIDGVAGIHKKDENVIWGNKDGTEQKD